MSLFFNGFDGVGGKQFDTANAVSDYVVTGPKGGWKEFGCSRESGWYKARSSPVFLVSSIAPTQFKHY